MTCLLFNFLFAQESVVIKYITTRMSCFFFPKELDSKHTHGKILSLNYYSFFNINFFSDTATCCLFNYINQCLQGRVNKHSYNIIVHLTCLRMLSDTAKIQNTHAEPPCVCDYFHSQ